MVMACFEVVVLIAPLWIATVIWGVVVGWLWRPKWVKEVDAAEVANSLSLANFGFIPNLNSFKIPLSVYVPWISDNSLDCSSDDHPTVYSNTSSENVNPKPVDIVGDADLQHLCRLVEEKDGGPAWIPFMERSTPTMLYKAWRRDPESGPFQCRSRTVFEDVSPELVRDFFWDDEFRKNWDDILVHSTTLEECPVTGTMLVHWIKKFPMFLSDREYTIGRRIWESGRSYYCVTKGVTCSAIPRRKTPWRVDLYYSSWFIRPVESMRGDGQLTATEVTLFHHEDVGIPLELAKLGMKKGMWLVVKKIEPGLRKYQQERASNSQLSRSAFMAQINTKVNPDLLNSSENSSNISSSQSITSDSLKPQGKQCIQKLVIIGGALVVACSLDRLLLAKALVFGAGRGLAKIGKRM